MMDRHRGLPLQNLAYPHSDVRKRPSFRRMPESSVFVFRLMLFLLPFLINEGMKTPRDIHFNRFWIPACAGMTSKITPPFSGLLKGPLTRGIGGLAGRRVFP